MSRSYKKTPGFCDRNPFAKRRANKRIRKISVYEEIKSGCSYKKYFCPYNICDFYWLVYSKSELEREAKEYFGGKKYKMTTK